MDGLVRSFWRLVAVLLIAAGAAAGATIIWDLLAAL